MVWKTLTVHLRKYAPVFGDGSEWLLWNTAVIHIWDVFALNIIVLFTQRESNKFSSHAVCMAVFSFHVRDDCVVLQHYTTVFTVTLAVSSLKALSLISSVPTLLTSQNLSPFPFTDDCFWVIFMQILFFWVNITPEILPYTAVFFLPFSPPYFHSFIPFCS